MVGGQVADQIYIAPPLADKPKITRIELKTSEPHNVQMNGKPMEVHIELQDAGRRSTERG